jgi:fatty-acyl-CoA synthase
MNPAAYDYPLIIRHLLTTPLTTRPAQPIVYSHFHRYDYHALNARVHRLANALTELGIRKGDTVAVMDWDSHRYLECFFAVPMMGAVLHTINIRLSPAQILYTINHAEDTVILTHGDFFPLLEEIRPKFEREIPVVYLEDRPGGETPGGIAGEYEGLLAAAGDEYPFEDFEERTRATTFYTTGTTGEPKGVYYSHRQLVLHTLGAMAALGSGSDQGRFHRDDVYMPITPMFHVHAWGIPYVATVMGVKQVYPGRFDAENLLHLIREEGVTFSHCVPTLLHMLLNHPMAGDVDFSNFKVVIGGAALPIGLAKQALDSGIDIMGGYGLSETCPMLVAAQLDRDTLDLSVEEQLYFRTKAGRPLPLVDIRIVDDDMNELERDGESTGEVVVRAPWLTEGYLKNEEASAALWRGGYLHTGDIGHLDRDGYLKVTDRLKDVIKSGGEWVSSVLLEDLVSQHPGVSEVAAISIPDEKWGERPLLLIVRRDRADETVDAGAIAAHLRAFVDQGIINTWAVPERIEFVDVIDKTSVGKIDKKRLRQRYGQQVNEA